MDVKFFDWFVLQEEKFGIAVEQYGRVVRLLDGYFSNDEKEKRDPLLLAGHLNLAACHLKLNHNFKCIKECEKVIWLSRYIPEPSIFKKHEIMEELLRGRIPNFLIWGGGGLKL